MLEWLAPALGFVVVEGILGIATKLALRDLGLPELLLWAALAYAAFAAALIVIAGEGIAVTRGAEWAALSGFFAVGGLFLFYLGLSRGEVSQVVPVTAAYPVATAIFAALFLSEHITVSRVIGTLLVVGGVVILSGESLRRR